MSSISKPLALAVQMLLIFGALAGLMTGAGADEGKAGARAIILIHDVYELQNMSLDLNGSYELANDIDASDTVNWNNGAGFEPVGDISNRFTGSLDGKNQIIKGLFIDRPNTDFVGLFGFIYDGGSVNNTGLVDVDVTGGNETGALVGTMPIGTVNNSYSTGNVIGQGYTGGLGGYTQGTVANSYASGEVSGHDGVGGLLGCGGGYEKNSYATGNVSGNVFVGGLIGYMQNGEVSNSYATGSVVGSSEVGGFIGSHNFGVIRESYATGNVVGNGSNGSINYIGGFIGIYYNGDVSESYASGNVTAQGDDIGGFAGYVESCTINNTYARGNVAGTGDYIGGFAGSVYNSNVNDSYATGYVTGTGTNIGGFAGYKAGAVSGCFWDNETSGRTSSAGGTGKNTTEMKTLSTFTDAGWDFDNIWSMIENVTYPYLRNVSVPPVNHAPTITTLPVTNVTADSLYSVQFLASDPDNDSLTWNMSSNASWLGMTSNGLLSGTPSSADLGIYIVAITVSDGRGGTDSLTFELSVSAKHLISWTDAPVDANLTEGDNYSFTARATDTYPEHALAYSVTSAENCTLTVNSSTGAIQWLNVTAGNYSFTLSVTDGVLTISHDFVLSVAKRHAISWTEVPGDANLIEGDNYTFTAGAIDSYPELTITYSTYLEFSMNSTGNATLTVNSSTGEIVWNNVTAGKYWFILFVTDGSYTDSREFVLSVAKKHSIAWTEVPGDTNLTEGDNYTFTARATDTYPEHALAYSVNSTGNTTLTVNSSTGAIQWLNVTAGNHSFTLSATDGELTISHDFVLSVAKKVEPFLAPSIISVTGPENITVKASSVQTFSVDATSPSGANLTYEWKENGVTLSTERTFSQKFPPGNHTLILLIGDGRYTTTRTFNFTVAPPPKTISVRPVSVPGFEAGIVAAAVITVVAIGLFWRRERR